MGRSRVEHSKASSKGRDREKGKGKRSKRGVKTGLFGSAADLRAQLGGLGLRLVPSTGDGNCLFRSVCDQLWGEEGHHEVLRGLACAWLAAHAEEVKLFLDEDEDGSVADYCASMSKGGVWGGNMELVALSGALCMEVYVHQAGHPSYTVCTGSKERGTIHVGYSDGDHYDSVRAESDRGGHGSAACPIAMPTGTDERVKAGEARRAPFPSPEGVNTLAHRLLAGEEDGPVESTVSSVDHGAEREAVPQPSPIADVDTPEVAEAQKDGQREGGKGGRGAAGGKPRRNGPCPCGSKKLYRKCCESIDEAAKTKAKAEGRIARKDGRDAPADEHDREDATETLARGLATIAI